MIIVKLQGGLGNQMFQYATGKALSLNHHTEFKMDASFLLDRSHNKKNFIFRDYDLTLFKIPQDFATPSEIQSLKKNTLRNKKTDFLLRKISGGKPSYFKEPYFHYFPGIFSLGKDLYLDGYWQSEKYFIEYENEIRDVFTFKNQLSQNATGLLEKIPNCNAICVNVRRGDFVSNSFHGALPIDYYKEGESTILEKVSDPHFYIFSDDIDWCTGNLKFSSPSTYVSHEYAGEKFGEYMQLMIHCKHFIIPNSSFGWWAAWLNNNPDKIVVAPKNWFNKGPKDTQDLLPAGWIKI